MAEVKKVTDREALRPAMRKALQDDPRVFLMGEDVNNTAARLPSVVACAKNLAWNGCAIHRCQDRLL